MRAAVRALLVRYASNLARSYCTMNMQYTSTILVILLPLDYLLNRSPLKRFYVSSVTLWVHLFIGTHTRLMLTVNQHSDRTIKEGT